MATPIILTRVPEPRAGSNEIGFIELGFTGINVTGRQIRTGRVNVTNEFYGREAVTRTIAQRATTKRYTGWWSAEEIGEQHYLAVLYDWVEQEYTVLCNDDPTGSEWEIIDVEEKEERPYGRDHFRVDFMINLMKR